MRKQHPLRRALCCFEPPRCFESHHFPSCQPPPPPLRSPLLYNGHQHRRYNGYRHCCCQCQSNHSLHTARWCNRAAAFETSPSHRARAHRSRAFKVRWDEPAACEPCPGRRALGPASGSAAADGYGDGGKGQPSVRACAWIAGAAGRAGEETGGR